MFKRTWQIIDFLNNHEQLYFKAQLDVAAGAFFPPQNIKKNIKFIYCFKNHENSYSKLIYTLPQALFPQKWSKKCCKYENLKRDMKILFKSSSVLCRRRFLRPPKFNRSWTYGNLWHIMNKHETSHVKTHLYSAAGAFSPKTSSTNHEMCGTF